MFKNLEAGVAYTIVLLGVVHANILSIQHLFKLFTSDITLLSGISVLCGICSVGVLTTVAVLLMFGKKDG